MSASDSQIPFSIIDGALVLSDGGANSLTVAFIQTEINWTEERAPVTEARTRNKHASTPVLRKTGDGNCTGSFMALVSSLYGSADETVYEVLTGKGTAAGWTTTAAGDAKTIRATFTGTNPSTGGATQSVAFNYCYFANVKIEPGGADGLTTISADFTDYETTPTVS